MFENVTIKKAVNSYFDGKVTSRTITFESGEVITPPMNNLNF
jgi:hypothetical protein